MDSDPKQSGQEQGISLDTNKEFQGIEDVENQTDIQIPEIINNRAKSSEKKGKRTRKSGTPVVKKYVVIGKDNHITKFNTRSGENITISDNIFS